MFGLTVRADESPANGLPGYRKPKLVARFVFFLGVFLVLLPFLIWGGEVVYAHSIGATGERLAMAGFYGVLVGFYTMIPGLILCAVGGVGWLVQTVWSEKQS